MSEDTKTVEIHESATDYYITDYEGGVYVQRKQPLLASERPLSTAEKVIINLAEAWSTRVDDWIDVNKETPKEGENVFLFIIYQRMCGGICCEDEIVLTGGIKDGEWFVGNEMIMWDYSCNLDFTSDDITHWKPISPPKASN